jgi:hypothetical protein
MSWAVPWWPPDDARRSRTSASKTTTRLTRLRQDANDIVGGRAQEAHADHG